MLFVSVAIKLIVTLGIIDFQLIKVINNFKPKTHGELLQIDQVQLVWLKAGTVSSTDHHRDTIIAYLTCSTLDSVYSIQLRDRELLRNTLQEAFTTLLNSSGKRSSDVLTLSVNNVECETDKAVDFFGSSGMRYRQTCRV